MRISIVTLGCRTNQAESLKMERELRAAGHEVVPLSASPDFCILNTCSVTSKADADSRRAIDHVVKRSIRSVVTGCFAELYRGEIERSSLSGTVELVTNDHKNTITRMVPQHSGPRQSLSTEGFRTRPIIKVQEGCDFSCSYCVVPRVRGRSRSVPAEEVVAEVQYHEREKKNEVVLSGTHLGTYGRDFEHPLTLSFLLKRILRESAIPRIRLSSLEIKEMDEEFLEVLSDTRMCKHLHVPLQSGDDKVLKLMNRTYGTEEFRRKIDLISKRFPDIALGTDVIVGFPGEGEAEFRRTRDLVACLPFSYVHVFPYSHRPGTEAARCSDNVSDHTKKQRLNVLRELSTHKRVAYISAQRGKRVDAIMEKADGSGFVGTSSTYIKILLASGSGLDAGMLVDVEITGNVGERAVAVPVMSKKVPQL